MFRTTNARSSSILFKSLYIYMLCCVMTLVELKAESLDSKELNYWDQALVENWFLIPTPIKVHAKATSFCFLLPCGLQSSSVVDTGAVNWLTAVMNTKLCV